MPTNSSSNDLNQVVDKLVSHFSAQVDTLWDKIIAARKEDLQTIDENFKSVRDSISELIQDKKMKLA